MYASAATLQLPYNSVHLRGTGVSSLDGTMKANPFNVKSEIDQREAVENDVIKRTVVKTAYDQAKAWEVSTEISGSGWGASMKASMQYNSASKLSVREVKFVASRKITYGFRGWSIPPKMQ